MVTWFFRYLPSFFFLTIKVSFLLLQFPLPHPLINSLKVLDVQVFALASSLFFFFFFSHWCWPSLSETFGWRFSNHSTYQQPLFHHLASENINTFQRMLKRKIVEMSTLLLILCSQQTFSMNVQKENWGSEEEEYHIMRFTTISIFYEKTKFMKQAHFSLRKKMYQVTSMPKKLCH